MINITLTPNPSLTLSLVQNARVTKKWSLKRPVPQLSVT